MYRGLYDRPRRMYLHQKRSLDIHKITAVRVYAICCLYPLLDTTAKCRRSNGENRSLNKRARTSTLRAFSYRRRSTESDDFLLSLFSIPFFVFYFAVSFVTVLRTLIFKIRLKMFRTRFTKTDATSLQSRFHISSIVCTHDFVGRNLSYSHIVGTNLRLRRRDHRSRRCSYTVR